MGATKKTLLEQLKLTSKEIARRKEYFNFSEQDHNALRSLKEIIAENVDTIVDEFYQHITPFAEMDLLIGDSDTLEKLRNYQRAYILSLFDGHYDEDYVHSRLRIGVVHKRIGVDPKYYVSAVFHLGNILRSIVTGEDNNRCQTCISQLELIDKILLFDLSLIFDTYIHSLMGELKRSQSELESYTESLEGVINERTKLLKEQARHDGLTGLLNQHYFYEELRRELSRNQRRGHATCLIYFDLDGFKQLNDTRGHREGDRVLVNVANAMKESIREGEILARYGGDEFCVIMPESSTGDAKALCKRICKLIETHTRGMGISCSMGIAVSTPDNVLDGSNLVKEADEAMYMAKQEKGFSIKIAEESV